MSSLPNWTHEEIETRLTDYLEGLLQPEEQRAFDAHISTCAQCEPLLASVSHLLTDLHSMDEIEPPPRLIYAILDKTLGPRETVTGWRAAFAIFGAAVLPLPLPVVAALLQNDPAERGLRPDGDKSSHASYLPPRALSPQDKQGMTWHEIWHNPTFWILISIVTALGLAIVGTFTYGVIVTVARYGPIPTAIAVIAVVLTAFAFLIDPFRRFETASAAYLLHLLGAAPHMVQVRPNSALAVYPHGVSPFLAVVTPSCSSLSSVLAVASLAMFTSRQLRQRRFLALGCALLCVVAGNILRIASSIAIGLIAGQSRV